MHAALVAQCVLDESNMIRHLPWLTYSRTSCTDDCKAHSGFCLPNESTIKNNCPQTKELLTGQLDLGSSWFEAVFQSGSRQWQGKYHNWLVNKLELDTTWRIKYLADNIIDDYKNVYWRELF